MTIARLSWTCDVCKKPIRSKTGYVTIGDARTGGYPQPKPEPPAQPHDDQPNVTFAVMHADCDPHPNTSEYWFGVERARTLTHWLTWASHLGKKSWMGKRELLAFIGLWFENRGVHHESRIPW